MPRSVSLSFRKAVQASQSADFPLAFVTLTHADLATPLRVVSDTVDYVWMGNTYTGVMFDIQILKDDDSMPEGRLTIPNVDQSLGVLLLSLKTPPRIKIELCNSADFNLTVTPRVSLVAGGPPAEYTADALWLYDVTVDAMMVQGRVASWNYDQELWPSVRCTQDRTPGLFR